MVGVILVMALIGGVYTYGRYSADNEETEKNDIIKNKDVDLIVKISLAVIASLFIVFAFMVLFGLLGFQRDQMGIVVAAIIVFTMIICTYAIIMEIRKLKL